MATPKGMRAKSIGHYILGKTIGEGTFGKVKLGTHILTGEKVAVKILEKENIVDVADVERVAREIHILKLVQHPHVIQLYEIIETPRQLYLIMEYCSGGELFDHIVASGRVKEKEAARFFHQILAGVERIHRMNVVHRDLKPENLLLDDQRNIKIVDFGLSNTFQEGQLLKTACGSPCYAAPEMIAGQRYVPSRCDIWSCGVILFALVCGYLPFEDQNTAALYRKILNADYQAPKFISDNVRDFVARMLTTDPEQRSTVQKIRQHPWYRQIPEASQRWEGERGERVLEEDVLDQLDHFGFPRDYAVKCLQMCKHNHVTTTYYLLLERKKRTTGKGGPQAIQNQTMPEDFAAGGALPTVRGVSPQEIEVGAEYRSRDPSPIQGEHTPRGVGGLQELAGGAQKHGSDHQQSPQGTAGDGDHAAGGSPGPQQTGPPKTPDQQNRPGGPNYGQWAQAFGLPMPANSARGGESPGRGAENRGDMSTRRTSAGSTEPPGGSPHGNRSGADQPLSARAGAPPRRASGETPRGTPGGTQPTPRRRSPVQQATGFATPRGPVLTPPLSQSATPGRGSRAEGRADGAPESSGPGAYRSRTPGKRPSAGVDPLSARDSTTARPGTSQGIEPLSARDPATARPGTSQGMAAPSRPAGPQTGRTSQANEVRRRQYTIGSDNAPVSARAPSRTGGGSASARGSAGGPAPAWAATRPPVLAAYGAGGSVSSGGAGAGGARASSASPEVTGAAYDTTPGGAAGGMAPLSAREARDESMRTCRGAFNVSCTSSKQPKQIMQEMHRALTLQRIAYKQTSAFLVKCQKQSLRFEMEISHLDHLESIYVVRFRRSAGDLAMYKELCSKILAEMKI